MSPKLLGLRTVIYAAPDLDALKNWYAQWLGFRPYFDQPFYVGFNVGGYELGLDPDAPLAQGSTIAYWGVVNIEDAWQHVLALGVSEHGPISDVGDGIKVSTFFDPAGNVVGLIENPHFQIGQ
jgi:catechol 2,3-dioxygenase-like lactoylglutathione lyase family enzyme